MRLSKLSFFYVAFLSLSLVSSFKDAINIMKIRSSKAEVWFDFEFKKVYQRQKYPVNQGQ